MIEDRTLTWREAWALTSELLRSRTTHLVAALHRWSYVPDPNEIATVDLFEGYVNTKRKKGTIPYRAKRPWLERAFQEAARRTPEQDREIKERRTRLANRLGLPPPD